MTATRPGSTATSRCSCRSGTAAGVLLALLACDATPAGRNATQALDLLAALSGPPTLERWRELHPGDQVWPDTSARPVLLEPHWCARADSAGGGPDGWHREAYFALPSAGTAGPPPPPGETAPFGADCRLALLLLWRPVADPAVAARLAGSLHDRLTQFGETAAPVPAPLAESASWGNRFYAREDSIVWLTATAAYPDSGRVVVAAWTPVATRAESQWRSDLTGDTAAWEGYWAAEAAVAAGETGVDAAATRALLALLAEASAWRERRRAGQRADLAPLPADRAGATIAGWLARLDSLPSDQQAAGLLAADIATDAVVEPFGLDHPGDSAPWARLGLRGPPGQVRNSHALLLQARRIDSLGALAERITLRLLQLGYDTGPGCVPGESVAPAVVRAADSLLGERPAGSHAAELHQLLALAHRDLAANPESRAASLLHARAALELEPRLALATPFWSEAYRLSRGLRPRRTAFLCASPGATPSP